MPIYTEAPSTGGFSTCFRSGRRPYGQSWHDEPWWTSAVWPLGASSLVGTRDQWPTDLCVCVLST